MPRQQEVARNIKETALEAARIGLTSLLCTGGMVLGSFALCSQVRKPENMLEAWFIGGATGAAAGFATARYFKVTPKIENGPLVTGLSTLLAAGAKIMFQDRIQASFTRNLG